MSAPWLKFYPSDWRADPALRMCSLAARGLWMEMLCVMHEATPRGFLLVNGKPLTVGQMAALAGCSADDAKALLAELTDAGVLSRDEGGLIFSRRMKADTEKEAKDKANGKTGGNPALKKGVNPPDKPEDKAQKPEARAKQEPPANAGGDAPPPALSPTDQLWTDGVATLETMHVTAPKARSMIGKWLKDTGGDAGRIHWAIGEAALHGSGDPIPYVARVLSDRPTGPPAPRRVRENSLLEGLEAIEDRRFGSNVQQFPRIAS